MFPITRRVFIKTTKVINSDDITSHVKRILSDFEVKYAEFLKENPNVNNNNHKGDELAIFSADYSEWYINEYLNK